VERSGEPVISVPLALVVTQWVVLLVLAALVLVMYRQLAHLLELSRGAHDAGGLDLEAAAPSFAYRRPSEAGEHRFTVGETPALLLFTDPRCGACDKALQAVESVTRRSRSTGVRVLVVTDGDEIAVAANGALSASALDIAIVERHVVTRDYRVTGTPLLVGVDADGLVRNKMAGPDEAAVRRMLKDFRERMPEEVGAE
jgi:hypothetical protein